MPGKNLIVTDEKGGTAHITIADVYQSNGVIQVVDRVVRAVTTASPPTDRSFELWAIGPGSTRPRSLGVIPLDGELKLSTLPPDLRDGATLAISIEPIGGSPTHQPTGPVVFAGSVKAV